MKEAINLKIPIVAVLDTNSDPTDIQFPIPGNDDARRSINLYCELLKSTIDDAEKNIAVQKDKEELQPAKEVSQNKKKSNKIIKQDSKNLKLDQKIESEKK